MWVALNFVYEPYVENVDLSVLRFFVAVTLDLLVCVLIC